VLPFSVLNMRVLRLLNDRLGIIRRLKHRAFFSGATFWRDSYLSHVPDRYYRAYDKYLATGGIFGLSLLQQFTAGNQYNNSGDLSRFFFLSLVCDQIVKDGLLGDTAELGVYKGNTGVFVARLAEQTGGKAYLFDTYEGFPSKDLSGIDGNKTPEFDDTSLEAVQALVACEAAVYVKGYFPESVDGNVPCDAQFCLVHIDCDLYAPFKAALEYFYPRLLPGGFLIMHDYSSLYWDGVESAVKEFFADKEEWPIPVPDKSGTVAVRKSGRRPQ
jgi:hypothetical protein